LLRAGGDQNLAWLTVTVAWLFSIYGWSIARRTFQETGTIAKLGPAVRVISQSHVELDLTDLTLIDLDWSSRLDRNYHVIYTPNLAPP